MLKKIDDDGFLAIKNRLMKKWMAIGSKNQNRAS